jgi:starch phosphorylase
VPSWDSAAADDLWTTTCGKERWLGTLETLGKEIGSVPDARLWQFRSAAGNSFVEYVRGRLSRQLAISGASPEEVEGARHLFDPNALTLGFARRFATYKRPNLLLHDPQRLLHLLTNPERPVQLVLAGKAHPADQPGQALIQEWTRFIERPEVRPHVIFLSDYDILLTEHLVQGVDVWINTPRRPWEACGTSGMKVLVNGGLNLSVLDGWWAEAYTPEVGWALGDGREHGDDAAWDARDAEELYTLLEQQVIPEFYARNERGVPTAWMARMRASMARLTPQFSANRAVREYVEHYYLPAVVTYRERAAEQETAGGWFLFVVPVYLYGVDPSAVRVELYAEASNGMQPVLVEMICHQQVKGPGNGIIYEARVPATRLSEDFTARIVSRYPEVAIPHEDTHILWQR